MKLCFEEITNERKIYLHSTRKRDFFLNELEYQQRNVGYKTEISKM